MKLLLHNARWRYFDRLPNIIHNTSFTMRPKTDHKMTYLSTVFSFLRRVSAYFQNLTIQCLLTQVSTLELCFILFCITVGLMLRTLPTHVQSSLLNYLSTMMTQCSSSISGILRTHHIKVKYIITSKNIPSFLLLKQHYSYLFWRPTLFMYT